MGQTTKQLLKHTNTYKQQKKIKLKLHLYLLIDLKLKGLAHVATLLEHKKYQLSVESNFGNKDLQAKV